MAVFEATFGARLIGLDMARLSVLAITAVAFIAIQTSLAAQTSSNTAETEEVTVTGEATGSLTSGSPEDSASQKRQVPGAFTVRTTDDMELGRASNFEDLLQRTPGVFLQSENGAEVSKIIQLMRRTRSLRIVTCCLVCGRDFDGATDSQSLSIAGT
jgi:outer membrane receptor for ferrienterochelin and colicin